MPIIKRYPNRKLYDTAAKQYISLEGVADLVRAGAEVQVLDHTTGDDVTALVLMQVIVEQEKKQGGFVPQTVVAGLVQAGGDTLATLRRALNMPLDLVRQVDEEIERRVQALVGAGELHEEEGLRLREKLLALGQRATQAWPDELKLKRFLADHALPSRAELQSLTEQVAALEAELDKLAQEQKPAAAPRPRRGRGPAAESNG